MTSTEIRIALAEWDGWEYHEPTSETGDIEVYCKGSLGVRPRELPDYPNDLNAVHELEKKLNPQQESIYVERLSALIMSEAYRMEDDANNRWLKSELSSTDSTYRATASQRCEALLRTLNLWKD